MGEYRKQFINRQFRLCITGDGGGNVERTNRQHGFVSDFAMPCHMMLALSIPPGVMSGLSPDIYRPHPPPAIGGHDIPLDGARRPNRRPPGPRRGSSSGGGRPLPPRNWLRRVGSSRFEAVPERGEKRDLKKKTKKAKKL